MIGQIVVGMTIDTMVILAGGVHGIDVNRGIGEISQMMQEAMPHFMCYFMPLFDRQEPFYGYIDLGMKPMSQPAHPYFRYGANFLDMTYGMSYFVNHFGVYAVKQPCENRLAGIPDYPKDGHRDEHPHDGICQRKTKPYSYRPAKNSQAGQAIHPGMISVRNKGGAADFLADPDAKQGHSLIA